MTNVKFSIYSKLEDAARQAPRPGPALKALLRDAE